MYKKNHCKIIAEIGWNFLGNMNLAKKMILQAKKSGADFVKFQIWDPKKLKKGAWDYDGRRKIYEKAYLNKNKYLQIKKYCTKIKVKCFASVFNIESAKILKSLNDNYIKIPSHEAYNFKLINYCLKNFKFVFCSLGAIRKKELLKFLKFKNKLNFIPMHCVSSYPLNIKNCNFQKFFFLKFFFKSVGYSGHLDNISDAIFAIANGASYVEKHFTINKKLPGRDNKFALLPKDLKIISDFKINSALMVIDKGLDLQECEKDIFKNYRGRWSGQS